MTAERALFSFLGRVAAVFSSRFEPLEHKLRHIIGSRLRWLSRKNRRSEKMNCSRRGFLTAAATLPLLTIVTTNAISREGERSDPCDDLEDELRSLRRRRRRAKSKAKKDEIQEDIDDVIGELESRGC